MPLKSYMCTRNPRHRIGSQVRFLDGWYTTDNQFLQDRIESNGWFGSHIILVPTEFAGDQPAEDDIDLGIEEEIVEAPVSPDDSVVVATVPVDEPEAPTLADFLPSPPELPAITAGEPIEDVELEPEPEPAAPGEKSVIAAITATDLNNMKSADVRALATEIGIEHEGKNAARVRREIRLKLKI